MSGKDSQDGPGRGLDRRDLLRIGAVAALGGGVFLLRRETGRQPAVVEARAPARFTETCTGCTGCVLVCPTTAIVPGPGGPVIVPERCIRCGYCVAVCPVGGVVVGREGGSDLA
ncbi:MAG: DUF362 domain-containing protein [Desulfatibacillaceae bacterium]